METLRNLLGGNFFKALPPKLKVLLHGLEILIAGYYGVMLAMKEIFHDPVMTPLYNSIAWVYLIGYPFVRFLIQLLYGVGSVPPGTPPPTPSNTNNGN